MTYIVEKSEITLVKIKKIILSIDELIYIVYNNSCRYDLGKIIYRLLM